MIQEQIQKNTYKPTLDRRADISRTELIKEYIEPSKPVVLTNAADHWNAIRKFTPDFFKTQCGHLVKTVKGVDYTISYFVDLMLKSTWENPSPYPFNLNVEQYFPELLKDM